MLPRARRPVSRGANVLCDVQRGETHAATGVMNQHGFVFLQSAHGNQECPGRQIIHRNRSAHFKAKLFRLFKYLRYRNGHKFSLPAETGQADHRFASPALVNSLAGGFDHAGNLITHHARLRRSIRI